MMMYKIRYDDYDDGEDGENDDDGEDNNDEDIYNAGVSVSRLLRKCDPSWIVDDADVRS